MIRLQSRAAMLRRLVLAVSLVLLAATLASAQFDTGTITGLVTDATGAVVPHAAVTITNIETSFRKILHTDGGGNFTASGLPSGNYVLTASASNFAEAKSQPIVLNVGSTVNVNLALTVDAIQEKVEITGTTTAVDTASSTAGTFPPMAGMSWIFWRSLQAR